MKWYMLRKGNAEVQTESKERCELLQKVNFKLMSVVDVEDTSKCKDVGE